LILLAHYNEPFSPDIFSASWQNIDNGYYYARRDKAG
jgi:hypothetical protein